jgi:hypothetical protein
MNRAAKLFARPGIHNGQLRGLLGDIVNIAAAGRLAHATFRPIRDMGAGATMTPRVQRTPIRGLVGADAARRTGPAFASLARELAPDRRYRFTRAVKGGRVGTKQRRRRRGIALQFRTSRFSFSCTANQCSTRPARSGRYRLSAAGSIIETVAAFAGTLAYRSARPAIAVAARCALCAQDFFDEFVPILNGAVVIDFISPTVQNVLNRENAQNARHCRRRGVKPYLYRDPIEGSKHPVIETSVVAMLPVQSSACICHPIDIMRACLQGAKRK